MACFPDELGPTHAYVRAVADCWRLFGEVQADETTLKALRATMGKHP